MPTTTLVVVDEAYIEYVEDDSLSRLESLAGEFPNLVVTRTFSKAYGLAGLRVGYALSHPSVAGLLNRVRQAFNVNSIALAAARAALDDREHLQHSIAMNREGMQQLERGLDRLPVRRLPSRGNFILIDCKRPAAPVYEAMLRQGVIVRPLANYQLPNHLRLTIGTQAQNQRMLDALERALHVLIDPSHRSDVRLRSTAQSPRRSGSIRVPGDKSISHRALMLGGIAEGVTRSHAVFSKAKTVLRR